MSLKNALMKAGYKGTKMENERDPEIAKKKDVKQSVKHQVHRNFCEQCSTVQPDVEMFKHRNRSVDANWMCVNCADNAQIHDQFRVTNQSDMAKQKRYIRRYGPTRSAKEFNQKGTVKTERNDNKKHFKHNKPPHERNNDSRGNVKDNDRRPRREVDGNKSHHNGNRNDNHRGNRNNSQGRNNRSHHKKNSRY